MKEVTYEEWQKNPTPRMMWVWDSNESNKKQRKVIYFLENKDESFPVIALDYDGTIPDNYKHCAEIAEIEEPKTRRRMTNKEFALWILEGIREGKLRQWRRIDSNTIESVPCGYASGYENLFVENKLIRENGGEWHEPLVEVKE